MTCTQKNLFAAVSERYFQRRNRKRHVRGLAWSAVFVIVFGAGNPGAIRAGESTPGLERLYSVAVGDLDASVATQPLTGGGWHVSDGGKRGRLIPPAKGAPAPRLDGTVTWTALPLVFPGDNAFMRPVSKSWRGWENLQLELFIPDDVPEEVPLTMVFFTKDWDHYWRQIRIPFPSVRGQRIWVQLPVQGDRARECWEPVGHGRRWHSLTGQEVREFGLKFATRGETIPESSFKIHIGSVRLSDKSAVATIPDIRKFGIVPRNPAVGDVCEFSFELDASFEDPFDSEDVSVNADITDPDGATESVRGFYYEGFVLRPVGVKSKLEPHGFPQFKIRYTPRKPGRYRVAITARCGKRTAALPPMDMTVDQPAEDFRGFVRVDKDFPCYLSYASGDVFNGIGLNVRATYDTRYEALVPFTEYQDERLELYRRLFDEYATCGINTVEVWMCSWWLALEWIPDAPGNHGLGYMNQHRAWMLDQLVALAEAKGMYIILTLNNHGKVSSFCDQEWRRNPLNKANGGFLTRPEEFYTDTRAKEAFKRYAGYIVDRWAYSPHILMWKLFSEINLTGSNASWYKNPGVAQWHKEMAAFIKERDPYKHPVTTHWSTNYHVINDAIADLEEIDVLTTDAYAGNTRQVMQLIDGSAVYARRKNKPLIITEYGGSPMGDSIGNLVKQLHLGTWKGLFGKFAVTPMLWWFFLVDEQDLYSHYQAVSAFMEGEDGRGMVANTQQLPNSSLIIHTLQNPDRTLVWGYDTEYYYSSTENSKGQRISDLEINLNGLSPGHYEVEFWDSQNGTVVDRQHVRVAGGRNVLSLGLPTFERDFAFKVIAVKNSKRL